MFVGANVSSGSAGYSWFPDSEWADTYAEVWFYLFNGSVHLFDECVNVVASGGWVFSVWEYLFWCAVFVELRVGVEVVVNVNAVNVVASGDV